eukprot:Rmarinus@m.25476
MRFPFGRRRTSMDNMKETAMRSKQRESFLFGLQEREAAIAHRRLSHSPAIKRTSLRDPGEARHEGFAQILASVASGYVSDLEDTISKIPVVEIEDILHMKDPQDPEGFGRGILHYVAGAGFVEGLLVLLQYCDICAINLRDKKNYAPLHYAVASHQTIRKIRKTQHNVFKTDILDVRSDGLEDMLECTRLLCSAGANVLAATSDFGVTALHLAVGDHLPEIAVELLRFGADVNICDKFDRTPLHFACWGGSQPCVSVLVDAGADLTAKNFSGRTPLHVAALYGHTHVARYLVDAGADINAVNADHCTPVVLALRDFHTDFAEFLIDARCDMFIVDNFADCGFSLAVRNAPPLAVKVLDQHRDAKVTALSGGYEEVTYTFSKLEVTTINVDETPQSELFPDLGRRKKMTSDVNSSNDGVTPYSTKDSGGKSPPTPSNKHLRESLVTAVVSDTVLKDIFGDQPCEVVKPVPPGTKSSAAAKHEAAG